MGIVCASDRKPASNDKSKTLFHESLNHFELSYDYNTKVLGKGYFGEVRTATSKSDPSKQFAVKIMPKTAMTINTQCVNQEADFLSELDHPNLVKLIDSFETDKEYQLVMECCEGGELMDRYSKKGGFSEWEVAEIMAQAFSAVNYLHENNVVHRDIKPENFIFLKNDDDDLTIKLVDFGFAAHCDESTSFQGRIVGTPCYIAPEMIKGSHDRRCDNWSLGVLMYVLLTGHFPFSGKKTSTIFKAITDTPLDMRKSYWRSISKEAKELVKALLEKDPAKRMTAAEALAHPWIADRLSVRLSKEKASSISCNSDEEKTSAKGSTQPGSNSRSASFEETLSAEVSMFDLIEGDLEVEELSSPAKSI